MVYPPFSWVGKVSFKIRVSSEECIQPSHMHILLNISLKLARAWRMDIREPGLKTDPFVDKWGIRWNFENKPNRACAALGHRESRQEWWIVWSGWAVKMLEGTRGTSSWEFVWAGEFWHREGVCNNFWRDSNNFLELTPGWRGLIWATPSQNSCVVILALGFLKFKLKKKSIFSPYFKTTDTDHLGLFLNNIIFTCCKNWLTGIIIALITNPLRRHVLSSSWFHSK